MHTVASTHAFSTIHEYVQMAKQRGLSLINISDHGPGMEDAPHIWHFGNFSIMPRVIDGVMILKSMEANILNTQGDIDCPVWLFDEHLDFLLAGFHESACLPMSQAANTQAMINAMASGRVHLITHPGNPKYPIDIKAVAEAAAEYHVALELNDSSFIRSRKGSEPFCIAIAQAVKEAGGLLGLGSDSHSIYTLGELEHCKAVLDEVDFPKERVLNQSVDYLLDFIQRKTGKEIKIDFERAGQAQAYQHKLAKRGDI